MANFSIPNNGQIRQIPDSEVYGELNETFGIDLSSLGKVKSAKRMLKVVDNGDDSNFGTVYDLVIYGSRYYAITGGANKELYYCSVLNDPTDTSNWLKQNVTSVFGEETTAEHFDGKLVVSTDDDITSFTNITTEDTTYWTTTLSGATLTTGVPHVLHTHRGGAETLFVTNGSQVKYYNAGALHETVALQNDLTACCIASGISAIWVGTYTESGSAYVYEIYIGQTDPETGNPIANNAFKIEDAQAVLSIGVKDNIPYIVTDNGHIKAFNGAGFTTVASFPFAYTGERLEGVRAGSVSDNSTGRPVHPRGMKLDNDSFFININTEMYNEDKYPENSPTGIWEFNIKTGQLTHRSPFIETEDQDGFLFGEGSGALLITGREDCFALAAAQMPGNTQGLFAETTSKHGHFITAEVNSDTIQSANEAAYMKAKTLTGSDNIMLKYRLRDQDRYVVSGTWLNTTTFNTTETLTVNEGDEITMCNGTKAGKSAVVVEAQKTASVTSVTLDAALGTAGVTAVAEFKNFKPVAFNSGKLTHQEQTYTSEDGEVKHFGGFDTNTWIQYKVIFNGDVEMREFTSKTNEKQGR